MTLCACFLLFAADSLGRRRSLLWTSIAMGCAMLYVGLYVRIKPPVKGADIPGAGYMALVCIYLFAGFFQCGWGPVPWIYVSEIPTARLRGVNVALGAATQWVCETVFRLSSANLTFCSSFSTLLSLVQSRTCSPQWVKQATVLFFSSQQHVSYLSSSHGSCKCLSARLSPNWGSYGKKITDKPFCTQYP